MKVLICLNTTVEVNKKKLIGDCVDSLDTFPFITGENARITESNRGYLMFEVFGKLCWYVVRMISP